jgi:hypothetical protein
MTSESFCSPSYRSLTPKDSRSVANAMRALHERIKTLELENIELKDRLIVLDSRAENDREKWQIRMMEEVQISKDKQDLLQSKLLSKEEEIKELKKILKAGHCQDSQFYLNEIQSLTGNISELKQKIASFNDMKKIVEENRVLKEKVKQEGEFSKNLQKENKNLKLSLGHPQVVNLKNYENSEEISEKFKNLEKKFQNLNQVNLSQNRLIEDLKKEVSRLSKLELSRQSSEKSKPKSKNNSKSIKSTRSNSQTNRIKHDRCNSSQVIPEIQENEFDIKIMIQESEKNLSLLNSKYKNLIGISHKDPASLLEVRKNLSLVADEIDQKSDELFLLKKKHQEFLRAKLYS